MLNKVLILRIVAILSLIAVTACNSGKYSKDSAVQTLSDYVSLSFAVKSKPDKARFLALTTGDVHDRIQKMSDAEFHENFEDGSREFVSLKIRDERQASAGEYSVTYEITYISKQVGDAGKEVPTDKVTNKKNALFKKENGHWLISEVQNIKTTIEHQNAISL